MVIAPKRMYLLIWNFLTFPKYQKWKFWLLFKLPPCLLPPSSLAPWKRRELKKIPLQPTKPSFNTKCSLRTKCSCCAKCSFNVNCSFSARCSFIVKLPFSTKVLFLIQMDYSAMCLPWLSCKPLKPKETFTKPLFRAKFWILEDKWVPF